jgi:hypothetical protein
MKQQNYANHTQLVPGFHFLTYAVATTAFVLSVIRLIRSVGAGRWLYRGILPFLICTAILLLCWYARAFALKAQDRAIRAEESLRYFILTGKPLPNGLRVGQIVALRFASDSEFVQLTERAVSENLSSKQIKQSIKDWRADHYRV